MPSRNRKKKKGGTVAISKRAVVAQQPSPPIPPGPPGTPTLWFYIGKLLLAAGAAGMFIGALQMLQVSEFAFAELLLLCSCGIACYHLQLIRTPWHRAGMAIVVLGFFAAWIVIAARTKGDKAWSNLLSPSSNPVFHVVRGNASFLTNPAGPQQVRDGFYKIGRDSDGFNLASLSGLVTLSSVPARLIA